MGQHTLTAADNTYKVALVNTSAFVVTNANNEQYWYANSATWDISEDAGFNNTGYTAQGLGLSGLTVSAALGGDEAQWDATDLSWASSTIDARGAVIYRVADGSLVCAVDFASTKSSSNGTFSISWNSQGIINLG